MLRSWTLLLVTLVTCPQLQLNLVTRSESVHYSFTTGMTKPVRRCFCPDVDTSHVTTSVRNLQCRAGQWKQLVRYVAREVDHHSRKTTFLIHPHRSLVSLVLYPCGIYNVHYRDNGLGSIAVAVIPRTNLNLGSIVIDVIPRTNLKSRDNRSRCYPSSKSEF